MNIIRNSSAPGASTKQMPSSNFTGTVYLDSIHADAEAGVMIGNVTFLPGAHTHWHTHEKGQILRVVAGAGWICDRGGTPQSIGVGDTVWCPPGTTHWHGADEGSYMCHTAISLGKTEWLEEVDDNDYTRKGQVN